MNQNNQKIAQHLKALTENQQTWKSTLATVLGLVAGTGAVYAVEIDSTDPVTPESQEEHGGQEDVTIVNKSVEHVHTSSTPETHPTPGPNIPDPDPNIPDPPQPTTLPKYEVVDHSKVTLDTGETVDVAVGVTEEGHYCLIVDLDLDGKADFFIEDTDGNGTFENDDPIVLAEHNITVSMDELPMYADFEPDAPTLSPDGEVIVPDDPIAANDRPETDDQMIDGRIESGPDYTLAQNEHVGGESTGTEEETADFNNDVCAEPDMAMEDPSLSVDTDMGTDIVDNSLA